MKDAIKMNIILCGFMGCGKSTIGKLVSKKIQREFIDLDEFIMKKHGMSINEIFKTYGEDFFRHAETDAIKELVKKDNLVLALGGGAVLKAINVELLKSSGKIIFLDVTANTVFDRLKNDTSRPLLNTDDKLSEITKRLNDRLPVYTLVADKIIDANDKTKEIIATEIIEFFK